jgi:hypothetical protein
MPWSVCDVVDDPTRLDLHMQAQPDDRSCGPTCLQAVYRYFGLERSLPELIDEIPQLQTGGMLAVQLGCHALRSGFAATVHTYNLQLFDPTWLSRPDIDLAAKLTAQDERKADDGRLGAATEQYLTFLRLGGRVVHDVLEPALIDGFLRAGRPILTGLSSTYLYWAPREIATEDRPDDVVGEPVGHFVVLSGYDPRRELVTVADPWPNPHAPDQLHTVDLYRVLSAILLGVLTYDANLLVIEPREDET